MMTVRKELAEAILTLSYGDLMDISRELADAINDHEVWPTFGTHTDFAALLHGWAEGQDE